MKLVKVKIVRGNKGESAMKYPVRYDAVEVDRMGMSATALNYASCSYSGAMSRAEPIEFCIIAMPDNLADDYATDADMEIITELEADTFMEQWRLDNNAPEETVTNVSRIQAITAKQNANMALTQEDLDALDSTKPVRGINKTRKPVREVLGDKLTT